MLHCYTRVDAQGSCESKQEYGSDPINFLKLGHSVESLLKSNNNALPSLGLYKY